jgi:hypothetical protein
MKTWKSGSIAPPFLTLALEVSGQLHAQGRSPWYPLDWRLDGPQSQCGQFGLEKNMSFFPARNWTLAKQLMVCSCTELSQLFVAAAPSGFIIRRESLSCCWCSRTLIQLICIHMSYTYEVHETKRTQDMIIPKIFVKHIPVLNCDENSSYNYLAVELSWCCDRQSVGLSALVSVTPLGPMTRFFFFLLLPENCFVHLGAPSLTRGQVCNL